jgi:hypothetical protein
MIFTQRCSLLADIVALPPHTSPGFDTMLPDCSGLLLSLISKLSGSDHEASARFLLRELIEELNRISPAILDQD